MKICFIFLFKVLFEILVLYNYKVDQKINIENIVGLNSFMDVDKIEYLKNI